MIILIAGASHTGKTALSQKLLEKHGYSYLSIDHLKMGLIRTGSTNLTPESPDEELTSLLWPIVREMIKTAIENRQNLIVEGCYIPYNWREDFEPEYLKEIKYLALIMSEEYIRDHLFDIKAYGSVIEKRLFEDVDEDALIRDTAEFLRGCRKHNLPYLLIEDGYPEEIEIK